jgi:hypothetical protein
MKQQVWLIYGRNTKSKGYSPLVYSGHVLAYDNYASALKECDMSSEVVVEGTVGYKNITRATVRRLIQKQYDKRNRDELCLVDPMDLIAAKKERNN